MRMIQLIRLTAIVLLLAFFPAANPIKSMASPEPLLISYAEASNWLETLPQEDRDDQIRDWSLIGLADLLELDVETQRNIFYDQMPVRDPLFYGLSRNAVGAGRAMADAGGVLHILAPLADKDQLGNELYPDRAIGMAIDDYRKDSGVEPEMGVIYRYSIVHDQLQVTLFPEAPVSIQTIREENGFVEMPLESLTDLEKFLAETTHLSFLELRDGKLWAGGWKWSDLPKNLIAAEDLTVLQNGYQTAAEAIDIFDPSDFLTPEQFQAWGFYTELNEATSDESYSNLLFRSDYVFDELLSPIDIDTFQIRADSAKSEAELQNVLIEHVDLVYERLDQILNEEVMAEILEGQLAARVSSEPGFSLDPGAALTIDEFLAALDPKTYPGVITQPEVVKFAISLAESNTESELDSLLASDFVSETFESPAGIIIYLPDQDEYVEYLDSSIILDSLYEQINQLIGPNFTDLLLSIQNGDSPYQAARYDGGLEGTEVGMTYFYTDLVAKAWGKEVGAGEPTNIVSGFKSDVAAKTPWSHCSTEDESGRLWFGLRDESVVITDARIDIGSISTRVFTQKDNPDGSGGEVEPSYSFGRMIWWWDRHYQSMADYEPQYQRLDQLMRWGAAIAWLVDQDKLYLPEVPARQISANLRFDEWLRNHPELKWSHNVPFVSPPNVTTEALLTLYSESFSNCGESWIASGGISAPGKVDITNLRKAKPDLAPAISRGGLNKPRTTFSAKTGSGKVANFAKTDDGLIISNVEWDLKPINGRTALVATLADGRKVSSYGGLKTGLPETTKRQFSKKISVEDGLSIRKVSAQGVEMGELSVSHVGTRATVSWQPSILDHAKGQLLKIQDELAEYGTSLKQSISNVTGARGAYVDNAGVMYVPTLNAKGARWIQIEEGLTAPSQLADDFSFRLGAPGENYGDLVPYTGRLVSTKPPLTLNDGTPAKWMAFTPDEKLGNISQILGADAPNANAQKVSFQRINSDVESSIFIDDGNLKVSVDDQIFGFTAKTKNSLLFQKGLLFRDDLRSTLLVDDTTKFSNDIVLKIDDITDLKTLDSTLASPGKKLTFQSNSLGTSLHSPAFTINRTKVMTIEDFTGDFDKKPTSTRVPPLYYIDIRLTPGLLDEAKIPVGVPSSGRQVRIVTVEVPEQLIGTTKPDILIIGGTQVVLSSADATFGDQMTFVLDKDNCEESIDGIACIE